MTEAVDGRDVVVIGAGVIGSAIALELARRRHRVTVVDKLAAAGQGSTSASSAIVRFSYSTAAGVAMSYEGLHYWRRWADHVGDLGDEPLIEYVNLPMLMPKTAGGHHEAVVPLLAELGVPFEDLDLAEARRRFPLADFGRFGPPATLDDTESPFWSAPTDTLDGVVIMPEAGYISDPRLAAANLASAAVTAGADFRHGVEVATIDRAAGRVTGVTTTAGETCPAEVVVNAAGPHARRINELAGVLATMATTSRALRREVYLVRAPSGVDFDRDGFSMGDLDTGVYFRGERGNNILIGNTEPDCDVLEWVDDADRYDEILSEDGFRLHALRTARRLPGLGIPHRKSGLVSLYDATPDWTPIYDRTDLDGFYVACGTSGNQFKNAPVVGRVMAELIEAVEAGHDHDGEPLTVTGRHTGLPIDLATYSRNRVVPDGTRMNVLG